MRILLVEDEREISGNLATLLSGQGYGVDVAATRKDAYAKACDTEYDLLVIDRGLPDGDGIGIVRSLREDGNPALMLLLTARGQADDIVDGLNAGADDYLMKPFRFSELDARIRALFRRMSPTPVQPVLTLADLSVDTNSRTVIRGRHPIHLAPREYALLEYLLRNACTAVERMTLLEHVWNETTDEFSQTVDVHIRYLRKKIDDPYDIKLIRTVKGKGYMVCDR